MRKEARDELGKERAADDATQPMLPTSHGLDNPAGVVREYPSSKDGEMSGSGEASSKGI